MENYKGTTEQWAKVLKWGSEMGSSRDSCILELRARVEALEVNTEQWRTDGKRAGVSMTHPLTPPPELVRQWMERTSYDEHTWFYESYIAEQAAQWGWDQREPEIQVRVDAELEACCKVLEVSDRNAREFLYAARRPKPPSLKEQALADFDWLVGRTLGRPEFDERSERIRRALEALSDDQH